MGNHLLVTATADDGALAVVVSPGADMGLVAYETAVLARRLGALVPSPQPSALS